MTYCCVSATGGGGGLRCSRIGNHSRTPTGYAPELYDMHTIENGVKFCETRSKSYMGRTFLPIVICHLAIFPPGSWKFVKTTLFRTSTYQHLHKKCYTRSGHNQHDHDFSIVQHGSRYLRKCCKIQEIAIFEVYSLKLPA